MLGLRGPFGSAWPVKQGVGKDVVMVAGGCGLAPSRSAIYWFLSHRKEYGKVSLLVGARKPEMLLYSKEMEEWKNKGPMWCAPWIIPTMPANDVAVSGW